MVQATLRSRCRPCAPVAALFARSPLPNDAWAEDAVSDTLLAALEKPPGFVGRSQLKTWLVGVLKHKVIDQLRRHASEATVPTAADGEDLDASLLDSAAKGHWRGMPADWGSPEAHLGQRQFFDVLEACTDHLPPAQGRVFLMREWLELSTEDICKELQITATNLWVLLYHARLRLRECLQRCWFNNPSARTA